MAARGPRRAGYGKHFLQQRTELQLGEEGAEGLDVGIADFHGGDVEIDGELGFDGDKLFAEKNVVAIVEERFAIGFLFDFGGAVEGLLDGAEAADKFDGTFVADAGRAGNVVDGVAAEGHDIDDAGGRDAEEFLDFGGIADEIVFGRIEDGDFVADELQHVLVAGDDEDGVRGGGGFAGEGADDIVGLVAFELEDGNAIGFEGAADVGDLLDEVGRHFGAVGLVALVLLFFERLGLEVELADGGDGLGLLVADGGGADIEDGGEVLGGKVVAEFAEHVDEDEDGSGGESGFGGHRPLARHGVIGAEDEGHGVNEEDAAGGGLSRGGLNGGGSRRGFLFGRQWGQFSSLRGRRFERGGRGGRGDFFGTVRYERKPQPNVAQNATLQWMRGRGRPATAGEKPALRSSGDGDSCQKGRGRV